MIWKYNNCVTVSSRIKVGEDNLFQVLLAPSMSSLASGVFLEGTQEEKSEIKLNVPSLRTGCESDSLCAFERMILLGVKLYSVTINYLFQ